MVGGCRSERVVYSEGLGKEKGSGEVVFCGAITNCHRLPGLKQHTFIILQLWRSESDMDVTG